MDEQYGWELAMILVTMPMILLAAFLFALAVKTVQWLWRIVRKWLRAQGARSTAGTPGRVVVSRDADGEPVAVTWQSSEAVELRNLLARIHGDGGHYLAEHGLEKAVADAHIRVADLQAMART